MYIQLDSRSNRIKYKYIIYHTKHVIGLSFVMLSMGVTSGRLVQESNACTVNIYIYICNSMIHA